MSITKRDIQLVEKEILDDLIRVCDENNIKYYLGQGTLIGAARYKGFIPWDDDIDVIMSYKDMDKLLEIYPKYGCEDYTITHFTNEKYNPLSWAKIRSDKTLSRPYKYKELPINWGICIDLFPYYPCSSNSLIRKFEVNLFKFGRKLNYAGMTQFEDGHGTVTRLLEKLPLWLRHFFLKLSFAVMSLHGDNSKYVVVLCKTNNVVERSIIEQGEAHLVFEGTTYRVPGDYHTYLTQLYGDYMTSPPEGEQGGHDLQLGEIEWKI